MAMSKKTKVITLSSVLSVLWAGVIVFLCCIPKIQRNTEIKKYYNARVSVFQMENLELGTVDVVFLGDEITENYDLTKHYNTIDALNRGIKNDSAGGIKNRLEISALNIFPSVVVLQVGAHKLDKILTHYEDILSAIKENLINTSVIVLSICPTSGKYAHRNEKIVEINAELKSLAEKYEYNYVDVHSILIDDFGEFDKAYTDDGLLPNEQGYTKITNVLKPVVNDCLN